MNSFISDPLFFLSVQPLRKMPVSCILNRATIIESYFNHEMKRAAFHSRKEENMALVFFLFWMILNGRWTHEVMLVGVLVTFAAMLFAWKACDWSFRKEAKLYLVLPRIVGYCLTVIWEIVKANLNMCNIVYFGEAEAVTRTIHTRLTTRLAKMALANAITLTPGTISVTFQGDELTVHCLRPELAEGLDDLIFERKLLKIEEALHG